ncbi:MAG: endolytic transglycosylase MltG [Clostridia bacterium]
MDEKRTQNTFDDLDVDSILNSSLKDDFDVNITDEAYKSISDTQEPVVVKTDAFIKRNRISPNDTTVSDYDSDKIEKKKKVEHKKRNKIKSIKNRRVFRVVWLAMVLIMGYSVGNYLIIGSNDFFAATRNEGTTQVVIPTDVTLSELSTLLEESGAIDAPEFFELYCMITTELDYFESGAFEISTNMDYEALINELQSGSGRDIVESLLFREGMTVVEVAELLEENGVCSAEEFLAEADSSDFDNYDMIEMITNTEDKYYKIEGYLFPNTYDFYVDEDVSSVIGKFLYQFQNIITVERKEEITNSGYTMDEIVIIASIIQAEAADEEDMARVSAVIHNRLEAGMSLGMDSTLYYPYRTSDDVPSDYTSDYSTYAETGLPEGAINSPGAAAIDAALNPDPDYSDMYYFMHDEDGNAYYASSLSEHQANAEKYLN